MPMMMMSRELKRVALDFDFPINETWEGYLAPSHPAPPCPRCGPPSWAVGWSREGEAGDGLSPEARQLDRTWYANEARQRYGDDPVVNVYQWRDKLSQFEVDALIEAGRLDPVIDCPHGCQPPEKVKARDGEGWYPEDPDNCSECGSRGWTRKKLKPGDLTPEQVNAEQGGSVLGGHDSINHRICVEARCEVLGFDYFCPLCVEDYEYEKVPERFGFGEILDPWTELKREVWRPTEPPAGPGFQMWQTVSEGGPVSPVFETADELVKWLAENENVAGQSFTEEEWRGVIEEKVTGFDVQTGAAV